MKTGKQEYKYAGSLIISLSDRDIDRNRGTIKLKSVDVRPPTPTVSSLEEGQGRGVLHSVI